MKYRKDAIAAWAVPRPLMWAFLLVLAMSDRENYTKGQAKPKEITRFGHQHDLALNRRGGWIDRKGLYKPIAIFQLSYLWFGKPQRSAKVTNSRVGTGTGRIAKGERKGEED